MFESTVLKRIDSFEVIDGEGQSTTPEEAVSADEQHTDSGEKQTEEEVANLETNVDHEQAVTQPSVEKCFPIENCDIGQHSSGEVLPETLAESPPETTITTVGAIQSFGHVSLALTGRLRSATRTKPKQIKQLFLKDTRTRSPRLADVSDRVTFERKWLFPLLFVLSGIILAQFFVNRNDSHKISQLLQDLATIKLEYAEALLKESKTCASRSADSNRRLVELQAERIQLTDELRKKSDGYESQQEESRKLILDLQAERLKLMDAVTEFEKRVQDKDHTIEALKEQNERLEATLTHVNNDLSRLRAALLDLRQRSIRIPGAGLIHHIICKLLRICPDPVL